MMSVIFVEVKDCELVNDFFRATHRRLQSDDLSKNMFRGKVKKISFGCWVVYMRSVLMFNLPKWALKLILKKGLRKDGYQDEVKFLSTQEGVMRLLKWDK